MSPTTASNALSLTAHELLDAYRNRTLSPVEVVEEVLRAIDELNPVLNAFLAVNVDDALSAARRAESLWRRGDTPTLCGLPISVKDSIEVAGMRTTYGSLAFRDNVQPDAVLVTRLREQGAVIIGKTNLPEFALSPITSNRLGPPCRNPRNIAHTAGGSSGGAAAAVAAGLGPIAIGTDSGGSVRSPAAYVGVFGIKPSYQRIPAVQTWRAAPGRSHNGPLTRTVDDAALVLSAIAGPHPLDPDSQIAPLDRDGWYFDDPVLGDVTVCLAPSDSDARHGGAVAEVAPAAARFLESHGARVIEGDFPRWEPYPLDEGSLPYAADHFAAAEAMRPDFLERHGDELTSFVRDYYERGRRVLAWQYRAAMRHDQEYRHRVRAWFVDHGVDYIVMQSTGVAPLAVDIEEGLRSPSLRDLVHFNMARNPGASIPVGDDPVSGLPMSVQVIGRVGDDAGVMRLARVFEQHRPWVGRRPVAVVKSSTEMTGSSPPRS